MNKTKKVILLSGLLFFVLGSIWSWYSAHKVDARELAVFQVFVQALDADTKKELNIEVRAPQTKFSEIVKRSGKGTTHYTVVLSTSGLVRATWIDLLESEATITLKAEGYRPVTVPSEMIDRTTGATALAGSRRPETILLHKTQPAGAGNG